MRRLIPFLALALAPVAWGRAAEGATTCFGKTPTYIGSSGADVVTAGYDNNVIVTRGGNDTVYVDSDSDSPVYICTGDGDDKIHGPAYKIHAGSGYDRSFVNACPNWAIFDGKQYVQKVELTTVLPCNG